MKPTGKPQVISKDTRRFIVIGLVLLIITIGMLVILGYCGVFNRISHAVTFLTPQMAVLMVGAIPLVISLAFLLTGLLLACCEYRSKHGIQSEHKAESDEER